MNKPTTSLLLLIASLLLNANPALAQSTGKPVDPDTLFNCTWSSATAYPVTILDAPATTVGGNLYVFGGVSTSIIATANKFDGATWTAIAPVPTALEFAGATNDGANCYILGGADSAGTPQTTLYRYNVGANTYTPLAPCVTGTWNQATVYLGGKIYKFAGTGPSTASTNVTEIYDVGTNTWSAGPAYPLAISFVSGWADGTYIYGAGGIQSVGSVASNKTYRLDPANLGAGWVDAAIADLPATRWGAATAVYTDAVLAGGYVAGTATANISNTAISYDKPSDTWQTLPNMVGERARFTSAVLGNSFYAIGGRSIASSGFVGTTDNQKLLCLNVPTNILGSAGSSVISAGGNGVLDPGETVTVALGAQNNGGPGVVCTTAALTGTLQVSGGVIAPSGPQNYGVLCSGSPGASRYFTFTVDPMLPCGSTVTASLQMQDGSTNYGTFAYTFTTGITVTGFTQNFDGVAAPSLPAGWTTVGSGAYAASPWVTETLTPNSPPNDAFALDPATVGETELVSPTFAIPAGGARVTFKNNYITESKFDGMVLEISIAGGAYTDILAAGGSFVTGGYNSTISSSFMNPLAGRMAWSGTSAGGYITSSVNLPAAANGQLVQLKWRMGSDSSVAATGVRIDDVAVTNVVCNGSAPASSAVSRKAHGVAGNFDLPLPIVAVNGAVGIEPRNGPAHTLLVALGGAGPWTLGGAAVTTGTGSASASLASNVVTINLTGVTDAQRVAVTLSNVSDGVNIGNIIVPMGVLNGDTNANGGVSGSDVTQTKAAASVGTVTGSNFRTDVNFGGSVNATDVTIVKSKSGAVLPP